MPDWPLVHVDTTFAYLACAANRHDLVCFLNLYLLVLVSEMAGLWLFYTRQSIYLTLHILKIQADALAHGDEDGGHGGTRTLAHHGRHIVCGDDSSRRAISA